MTRRRGLVSSTAESGFSLVEMLVVLSILSITLVALVPFAGSGRQSGHLDQAAREVALALRNTRASAINTNKDATFTLDASAGFYWSDANNKQMALPKKLAVAIVPNNNLQGQIHFFPDGSASGGTIQLRDLNHSYLIQVEALSGRIRIDGGH
jgi:general secretion pathway protein H